MGKHFFLFACFVRHLWLVLVIVYSLSSCKLYSCNSPQPSEYKLSDALNKVGYCMRLESPSFIGSMFPGPVASTAVNKP